MIDYTTKLWQSAPRGITEIAISAEKGYIQPMEYFNELEGFFARIPGIKPGLGKGQTEDGLWWIKFQIDIKHPLAWKVVQELGHIVNYISLNEKLPTVFFPVSPPPYMNGGPEDFLSWVIESEDKDFSPKLLSEWLEGRLPRPVEDIKEWEQNDKE